MWMNIFKAVTLVVIVAATMLREFVVVGLAGALLMAEAGYEPPVRSEAS